MFLHQIFITFKVFSLDHNALLQTIRPLFKTFFKFTYWDVLYAFQRFLFNLLHSGQTLSFHVPFQSGEQKEITGTLEKKSGSSLSWF